LAEGLLENTNYQRVRFAYASALVCSNDASVTALFRKLLTSNLAELRGLASLALGALQDTKSINNFTTLLADNNSEVRRNACIALGIISDQTAVDILSECLEAEDEIIRQTAAEALGSAALPEHAILKEAARSDNLLVRRAAAFGLARIKDSSAKELLKEIAIQDSQWVVRNAASQALDMAEAADPNIPHPLKPPSDTPWVIAYAGKLGVGIVPGDPAVEILLHALQSGSIEEKLASLDLVRTYKEEIVFNAVSLTADKAESPVREAAQLTLWFLDNIYPEP
jgi:HEAT repeat protein